jgi:hypothetical protein
MPSTKGPASGFLKTLCNKSPLKESEAPASVAASALGKRKFQIICPSANAVSFSAEGLKRILSTSKTAISAEPLKRVNRNAAMMRIAIIKKRKTIFSLP